MRAKIEESLLWSPAHSRNDQHDNEIDWQLNSPPISLTLKYAGDSSRRVLWPAAAEAARAHAAESAASAPNHRQAGQADGMQVEDLKFNIGKVDVGIQDAICEVKS